MIRERIYVHNTKAKATNHSSSSSYLLVGAQLHHVGVPLPAAALFRVAHQLEAPLLVEGHYRKFALQGVAVLRERAAWVLPLLRRQPVCISQGSLRHRNPRHTDIDEVFK
jgi:hypothetical protein